MFNKYHNEINIQIRFLKTSGLQLEVFVEVSPRQLFAEFV